MAAIALYATMTAGFQGALMVPTEILAQQHMESLQQLFDPLEVRTINRFHQNERTSSNSRRTYQWRD